MANGTKKRVLLIYTTIGFISFPKTNRNFPVAPYTLPVSSPHDVQLTHIQHAPVEERRGGIELLYS